MVAVSGPPSPASLPGGAACWTTWIPTWARAGGRAVLERLARRRTSQFIFLGGNRGEAAEVLRIARARGVTVPMLGGAALEGLEEIGGLAEGSYVSNAYLPSFDTPGTGLSSGLCACVPRVTAPQSARGRNLRHRVSPARRHRPGGHQPPEDPGRCRGDWAEQPPFQGVTGEIAFDQNGDVPRQRVIIGRIEHGLLRPVEGL